MRTCLASLLLLYNGFPSTALSFSPVHRARLPAVVRSSVPLSTSRFALRPPFVRLAASSSSEGQEEDEETKPKKENPYADPNYPELEFVDYSDPEYQVDQGTDDEFFDPNSTEAQIEAMRESRRRRNDEYQFQTFFADILKGGDEYKGEWSIYKSATFLDEIEDKVDANGFPKLVKAKRPLKVVSTGYKTIVETVSDMAVDSERIVLKERAVPDAESDPYKSWEDDLDTDNGFGRGGSVPEEDAKSNLSETDKLVEEEVLSLTYWPEALSPLDFRGTQGIMCVGNGYSLTKSVPLKEEEGGTNPVLGPFSEYRAELGLLSKQLRFRIKLDYRVKEKDKKDFQQGGGGAPPPALHLKSMVICRETREMWPPESGKYKSAADRSFYDALFGPAGASGGLYDPPPVGSDEQATNYMLLDLDGCASLLFAHKMEQDPNAYDGFGWVTSLDWCPGSMRYQIDRKIKGGADLMELRSLELSQVQGADADTYRPRDGGQDMRQ